MDHSSDTPSPPIASANTDPNLYLHPQTLARLSSMDLRAKMIVEGIRSGQHKSPYTGVSVEFAHHRPYTPGDDIRHLDWKVFARSDKLHIKKYQQETNLDLIIMVDSSGSMRFGSRPFSDASGSSTTQSPDGRSTWSKYDHATATAAALAHITLHQRDRAGLIIFADQIRTMVPRSSRTSGWKPIVDALSTHPIDDDTNITRVMDQTLAKLNNRCLIALISDCFMDPQDLKSALAKCKHRGHDLIVFQTLDHAETTFDFEDRAAFIGLESEPTIKIDPRALRDDYLNALSNHNTQIQHDIRAFGFDLCTVNTHQWLGPTLATFAARRNTALSKLRSSAP